MELLQQDADDAVATACLSVSRGGRRAWVGEARGLTPVSPSATIAENLSVLAWNDRPSFVSSLRGPGARIESHGRPTLSIYSFANAICRCRLFESITASELLRSADVDACNPRRPGGPAGCTVLTKWRQLDGNRESLHWRALHYRHRCRISFNAVLCS